MNVERLLSAIMLIHSEYTEKNVSQLITTLITNVNTVIQSASNPQSVTAFQEQYSKIVEVLEQGPLNKPHPTLQATIREMKADRFVGEGLRRAIDNAIGPNNLTPAVMLKELQTLNQEFTKFFTTLSTLRTGLSEMNITPDVLLPGSGEVTFSTPRDLIRGDLQSLIVEMRDYDRVLGAINEICGHPGEPIPVKAIASSDWIFYVAAPIPVLVLLSQSLRQISEILRSVVEITRKIKELKQLGLPDDAVNQVKAYADKQLEDKITPIAVSIVNNVYRDNDTSRKNELTTKLTMSLRVIAVKINNGVTIDIIANPPDKPSADPATEEGATKIREYEGQRAQIDQINQESLALAEFSKEKGEPLQLSYRSAELESDEDSGAKAGSSEGHEIAGREAREKPVRRRKEKASAGRKPLSDKISSE